jgi:Spy/CpxP family protein refolding chaperone
MGRKWMVATTMAVTIVLGAVVFAQAEPFGKLGKRPGIQKRARMRERIELMKMWKLTEALDLDQETAAKLFPLLRDQEEKAKELREKRREVFRQMKDEVAKDNPDSQALRQMIEKFKQNERDVVEMRNERIDELSKLLSDAQMAKLIIFVPKFKRDVAKLICEARTRRGAWRDRSMRRRPGGDPPEPGDGPPME